MLVLMLPRRKGAYTVKGLLKSFSEATALTELICNECNTLDTTGHLTCEYRKCLAGYLICRINRYSEQGKRTDRVTVEEVLEMDNGDAYTLQAILEHKGTGTGGGHYIVYIRAGDKWQKRDDAKVTEYIGPALPTYSQKDVYVAVYHMPGWNDAAPSNSAPVVLDDDIEIPPPVDGAPADPVLEDTNPFPAPADAKVDGEAVVNTSLEASTCLLYTSPSPRD